MPKVAKQITGAITRHNHKLGKLKAVKTKPRRGKSAKESTKAKKSAEAKGVKGLRIAKLGDAMTIKRKAQRLRKDARLDLLAVSHMIDRL